MLQSKESRGRIPAPKAPNLKTSGQPAKNHLAKQILANCWEETKIQQINQFRNGDCQARIQ